MEQVLGLLVLVAIVFFVWRSMRGGGAAEPSFHSVLAQNGPPIDVVGESFYKENFKTLKTRYGSKSAGQDFKTKATLFNESDNPHSKDGRAVRVEVDGLVVGHVPNTQVAEVYELLQQSGGKKTVSARIYFADQRYKVARNSVKVDFNL